MSESMQRFAAAVSARYAVAGELGSGGMATVYLAEDLKHHRQVAVKVLRPEFAAILGAERFLKEIEVTANLQHPNILPLYDSGEAGGDELEPGTPRQELGRGMPRQELGRGMPRPFLYYVMPYIEGRSLREKLDDEGRLDVSEATRIAIEVAEALDFAHRRGVVHRDIKPENILLQDGKALVADFGVALAVTRAGGERLTETGLSLGTPPYMSPEQAAGQHDLDRRSDVYALGTVLYEMLGGDTPFTGASQQELLARIVTESPPSIRDTRAVVPVAVADALRRALANRRDDRFATAAEFARALAAGVGPARQVRRLSARAWRVIGIAAAAAAIVVGVTGYRLYRASADRRWVREVAIPEMERLMGQAQFADAYAVALEAQRRRPGDSTVRQHLETTTFRVDVSSEPPGAHVWFSGYGATDTTWYDGGTTPLVQLRVPNGNLRMKFQLAGYRELGLSVLPALGPVEARLVPDDDPEDMVWIPAGTYAYTAQPVPLDSFRIDRHEVTNREFQRFVDGGGYDSAAYWTEPFVRDGRRVAREDAMREFVDQTGRPGPATWELSQYPRHLGDHPVSGVSWYEALAYCRSVGQTLPTFFHWRHAAGLEMGPWDDILGFSNFGRDTSVAVGSLGGVGPYGTEDMAGNVREWVWTETGGLRYILGGAWIDPEYMYAEADAADPWSRVPVNGFRCAKYPAPLPPALLASLEKPFFDFNDAQPVDDATFAIYRKFYEYEPTDLDARIESADTTEQWIKQSVSFTAAYGGERVRAYVFLPRTVPPPYQTVVYFPGSAAFVIRSSENLAEMQMAGFIPRSGRALVYPVYKGSYERGIESPVHGLRGLARRQWTIWVTQDLERTVDYVVSRTDLRHDAIGFLGLSLGGEIAVPVAVEKRFQALVLVGGAFDAQWLDLAPPEAAPWNFASRITTPTMLINGRRDFLHPYESGQVPYFNAFDIPDEDKEFVILDAGHIPRWNDVIRNALRWYDRYLGPVR